MIRFFKVENKHRKKKKKKIPPPRLLDVLSKETGR